MDISADLTRIALAENGELMELYYESKRDESLVGNIYAGRVVNVMPNLQAAFVDIGVHQDGLVHISRMAERFIKHPSEAVSVGDVVKVWVVDVDQKKKRIAPFNNAGGPRRTLRPHYRRILRHKRVFSQTRINIEFYNIVFLDLENLD